MAILPDVFVPEKVDEDPFKPIEEGWYLAQITKSELKDTNAKDGKYLALTFKVVEGEHKGRFIFTNLNLVNKNNTAVLLARADLKKICTSVNLDGELEDTTDLHGIPMMVKVTIKPASAQWPARNELKDYKSESFDPDEGFDPLD